MCLHIIVKVYSSGGILITEPRNSDVINVGMKCFIENKIKKYVIKTTDKKTRTATYYCLQNGLSDRYSYRYDDALWFDFEWQLYHFDKANMVQLKD